MGDALDLTYINSRVERDPRRDPRGVARRSGRPTGSAASTRTIAMPVEQENRRADRTGEPFALEYRMFTADDRIVWIRDEAVLVRDEQGNPKYWQGVMTDITARREAENEPGRGRGPLPGPGRADADDHLPGLRRRTAVHAVHEPAVDRDPRLHAAGLVRRRRPVRQAGAPRRRGARGTRARIGRGARRHVPPDREGRPHRVDPRPGAAHPGRRGQAEVLAGRADRHHGAHARPGARTRPDRWNEKRRNASASSTR